MARWLLFVATVAALAGCYNPRYPSDRPNAEGAPYESGTSQDTRVRERDRRDGAAGSGSSTSGY